MEPTNEALPASLLEEFDILRPSSLLELSSNDIKQILTLWGRYPFSLYFVFKIAFKTAVYRHNFEQSDVKTIICASEYSFTSSLLTEWCDVNDVEHINVMHGEKLFSITDCFAFFHRFYVWNEFYLTLVRALRCGANEFIVSWPKSFEMYQRIAQVPPPERTLTYMLQLSRPDDLRNIAMNLAALKKRGWKVIVRPHPRWADDPVTADIFSEFEFQNSKKVAFSESLEQTSAVCGGFSTALLQGLLAGRLVVLDDISEAHLFNKIRELDYILFHKPHRLLSEMLSV